MSKKKRKEKRKTDNVRPCWQRRVVGTGAERAGELSDGGGHGNGCLLYTSDAADDPEIV